MLFREFHKILNIQEYFDNKHISSEYAQYGCRRMANDIMKLIGENKIEDLKNYLYDYNNKDAYDLFSYITGCRKVKTKDQIYKIIEGYMLNLHDYIRTDKTVIVAEKDNSLHETFKKFLHKQRLNEEDDPFGDTENDTEPEKSTESTSDDSSGDSDSTMPEATVEDTHEDDPDFKTGKVTDSLNDVTPSAETTIDFDGVLSNLNKLLLGDNNGFTEFRRFKKDLELIASGKKLTIEDVNFGSQTKLAMSKLDTVLKGLDDNTVNYFKQKIRAPAALNYYKSREEELNKQNQTDILLNTI